MGPYDGDAALVAALKAGDEAAFRDVVERYGGPMRRLALSFVRVPAVADEVVQEAWLGVLRGIDRFEGRSSFATWLFRIVANTAKTRAEREGRSIPLSSVGRRRRPSTRIDSRTAAGATRPRAGRSSPNRDSCRPRRAK